MARSRAYKLEGSFGDFTGAKVYYLGFREQPSFLSKTGRGFAGLKHLLDLLQAKFKRFTLTFTPDEDSVRKESKVYKIRLSKKAVSRFGQRRWDGSRQLNLRLGRQLLSEAYPEYFASGAYHTYQRGMFSEILSSGFDPRVLSAEDRVALTRFVAAQSGKGSFIDIPTAYQATRDVQLLYLKRLVQEFDDQIEAGHDEAWWQSYFSKNILFFQDNYIRRIDKLNVIVAGTQFPDFLVVTSDGYLDVLEIKKPGTVLLKEDSSRHNHYWSADVAKAISQVENYIDNITKNSAAIRTKLRDDDGIDLRIIKPRGIVVAGRSTEFGGQTKKADDFRLLNEGLKNVTIMPYDELSQQLKNRIVSIERLAASGSTEEPKSRQVRKR
jgi:Domain of unknown function (DUF4263)